MPELPEVETVCNALEKALLGNAFIDIRTYTPMLRYPLDLQGNTLLLNHEIISVRRRGRYVIIELNNLHVLILHLGMTGKLRVTNDCENRGKHEHVLFLLNNGKVLRYDDVRRFGFIKVATLDKTLQLPTELSHLGPEPLSSVFNADYLYDLTRKRKCPVKNLIMDNHLVVGVGNIYANEALFLSQIHPEMHACSLSKKQCQKLVNAIKKVLKSAIQAGGTTIIDFKNMDGNEGKFHIHLNVYGKNGELCQRCRSIIEKVVIGGRSTFFCPDCQQYKKI
jgi:formamidopyrimidine-DNA glycosylase